MMRTEQKALPMTSNLKSPRGLAAALTDIRPPWARTACPVVFNHGIGTNRDLWAGWVPALAGRHIVARFDLRGYGQSPLPPVDHRWALEELIADLLDVASLSGPGPYHLVGESLGGTVVLATAARHPEKVASATVSNTAFKGAGIQYVMGWRDEFSRRGVEAWSQDMMERRFAPGAIDEAQRAWFASVQQASPAHVTVGYGEMLAATDLTPELPRIKCPLLILMPDRSPFVTARMGVDLLEQVPQSELAMFPGARHGLPFSHAAECSARLALFLARSERD